MLQTTLIQIHHDFMRWGSCGQGLNLDKLATCPRKTFDRSLRRSSYTGFTCMLVMQCGHLLHSNFYFYFQEIPLLSYLSAVMVSFPLIKLRGGAAHHTPTKACTTLEQNWVYAHARPHTQAHRTPGPRCNTHNISTHKPTHHRAR